MIPLLAETIFQQQERTLMSIESSLTIIEIVICCGGLITLIVVSVACTRLGQILNNLRLMNGLLKQIAEGRGTEALPAKPPALAPPLPRSTVPRPPAAKDEPDVYRI